MDRGKHIIRVSIVNAVGNMLLALVKGAIGAVTGSIAITLDAVNSVTDVASSIIAIIGTKLAGRPANHDHPFGYGRIEYLTSIVIAALILSAGISSLAEAARALLKPKTPEYRALLLAVVGMAAVVKLVLGSYLLRSGKRLNSGSLVGSGTDSIMDGFVSLATCAAGVLYLQTGWQIEPWLAAGIALLITKSGLQLLVATVSKLLGERADPKIASRVEREARSVDEVRLASGLVLYDFGPDQLSGSIHVTVDGAMTVAEFDSVVREVQERVYQACGVTLTGVTPYPDTASDENVRKVRATVGRIVWGYEHVVELRGLYVDTKARSVRFDAIAEFGVENLDELRDSIIAACAAGCPGWSFNARVLPDIGD